MKKEYILPLAWFLVALIALVLIAVLGPDKAPALQTMPQG